MASAPVKVPVYSGNGQYRIPTPSSQFLAAFQSFQLSFLRSHHKNAILNSSPDLKSTTDDSLAPYLTTLPQPYTFTQDHSKTNVRFALGYTAVSIAAFTFYADRKLGWEATTSPWILAAVASYFILNTVLTYWVWGVESGEIFRGKRQSGETVCIVQADESEPFAFRNLCLLSSKQASSANAHPLCPPRSPSAPPTRNSPPSTNSTSRTRHHRTRSCKRRKSRPPSRLGSPPTAPSIRSPSSGGSRVRSRS